MRAPNTYVFLNDSCYTNINISGQLFSGLHKMKDQKLEQLIQILPSVTLLRSLADVGQKQLLFSSQNMKVCTCPCCIGTLFFLIFLATKNNIILLKITSMYMHKYRYSYPQLILLSWTFYLLIEFRVLLQTVGKKIVRIEKDKNNSI